MRRGDTDAYKIGFSKHPSRRLEQLMTGSDVELFLVDSYFTEFGTILERFVRARFHHKSLNGEWVSLDLTEEYSFTRMCREIESTIKYLAVNNEYFRKKHKLK